MLLCAPYRGWPMPDSLSTEQRSKVMSQNKSKGNKSTEWALRSRLVSAGIKGWVMNSREVDGRPDFVFSKLKLAVFVDGCFWHGCRRHKSIPESNRNFWEKKIRANRERDKKVDRNLIEQGWKVIRIWEHEMKESPMTAVEEIREYIPV